MQEAKHPIGYQFKIRERAGERWTYIQGSGGVMGASALHVSDPESIARIAHKLLLRARRELERFGYLREPIETPEGPVSFRVEEIRPEQVLEVRAVYEQ